MSWPLPARLVGVAGSDGSGKSTLAGLSPTASMLTAEMVLDFATTGGKHLIRNDADFLILERRDPPLLAEGER